MTINANVERLLDRMKVEYEPEIVPVRSEDYATEGFCYRNVAEKIRRDGGKICYGRIVWEDEISCYGEHHAVWEDENGNLIDITSWKDGTNAVMFVPDNSEPYVGKLIDHIIVNTTNSSLVDDFIMLSSAIAKLRSLGKRVDEIYLSIPENVLQLISSYETAKLYILMFHFRGGKSNSPCFCKSGKSYRKCHGKNLRQLIDKNYEFLKRQEIEQHHHLPL